MAKVKKHWIHNAIWYVVGALTGGYAITAVKKVTGKI